MSGDLFYFPDGAAGLSWARVAPRGGAVKVGEPGARAPGADRKILLVPGEDVALHVIDLPARTDAQARAAAGFAVEDLVAQPLDDVFVTPGPRVRGTAKRAVAVVDRARFAAWRALLDDAGASVDLIIPDYLAVPASDAEVSVVDLGDRVLIHGGGLGFAVPAALAGEVLRAALPGDIASVRLWTDRPDALFPFDLRDGRDIAVEPPLDGDDLARLFQRGLDAGAPLDLGLADAGPDAGFALDLRRWRMAAALALAVAVSYAALMLVQTAALDRERAAAYAEAETLMRAAFPDMQRIVNPRAQLRARLGDRGGDGRAFLALSGLMADSVRDIETLEIDTIRFDAQSAALDVSIRYAAYSDVERLSAAVAARGGVLEEGGSRRSGDVMTSDIVVRAQP